MRHALTQLTSGHFADRGLRTRLLASQATCELPQFPQLNGLVLHVELRQLLAGRGLLGRRVLTITTCLVAASGRK
jgi:hypothetical protein